MRTKEVQLRVSLTGRYATALYKETIATQKVGIVLQDIRCFQDLLFHHHEIEQAFKSKFFQAKHIISFIEELAQLKNFSEIFSNFLKEIISNHRGNLIKLILKDFLDLIDLETNTVPVRIEIASQNERNMAAIEEILVKNYPNQTYRLEYHEKPELLAGFRTFIYDHCLDYSLKSRLNRLSQQLKEA